MNHDVVMRFSSEKIKDAFCTWMCDGGGEQELYNMVNDNTGKCLDFQYHSINENFKKDDKRRYGPFMGNSDEYGRPMIVVKEFGDEE